MRRLCTLLVLAGAVAVMGCVDELQDPVSPEAGLTDVELSASRGGKTAPFAMDPGVRADIEAQLTDFVRDRHADLAARKMATGAAGLGVAPLGFYWTGVLDDRTMGGDVVFEDRGNRQFPVQWVPRDPRRFGRTDVGYAVVAAAPAGLTPADVDGAIDRAMATWGDQTCSPGLTTPEGTLQEWLSFQSDILHSGFGPLPPGVLGVTSPFVFVDPATGEPTDIDGDGRLDYAFAIITYSQDFSWAIDDHIDVETVALHEAGHGLGQAHFGKAFVTIANGKLHFSPRALMNATYSGIQQSLSATDLAGHCSMYGSWPNN